MLIIGTLTGCATDPVELPDWDIPEASVTVQDPLALPPLPALRSEGTRAWIDRDGVIALEKFKTAAEANSTIALENGAALRNQAEAYNALREAGEYMNEIARIRQEMLDRERQERTLDRWFYRTVIVLGLVVGVTL